MWSYQIFKVIITSLHCVPLNPKEDMVKYQYVHHLFVLAVSVIEICLKVTLDCYIIQLFIRIIKTIVFLL